MIEKSPHPASGTRNQRVRCSSSPAQKQEKSLLIYMLAPFPVFWREKRLRENPMNSIDYHINQIAAPGSCCYYSGLSLPADKRQATEILSAYFSEIQQIPLTCRDRQIALAKLGWWYQELTRIYQNGATHPLAKGLATIISSFNIPQSALQKVLIATQIRLTQTHFSAEQFNEHLQSYHYLWVILTQYIFGYQSEQTLTYAKEMAQIFGLIHGVEYFNGYRQREILYFNVAPYDDIEMNHSNISTWQPLLLQTIREIHLRSRASLAQLPINDRFAQRFTIIMNKLALAKLNKIQKNNFNDLLGKTDLLPISACWLAWRTLRAEKLLHYRT